MSKNVPTDITTGYTCVFDVSPNNCNHAPLNILVPGHYQVAGVVPQKYQNK